MEEARGETAPVAPQIKVVLRLCVSTGLADLDFKRKQTFLLGFSFCSRISGHEM